MLPTKVSNPNYEATYEIPEPVHNNVAIVKIFIVLDDFNY